MPWRSSFAAIRSGAGVRTRRYAGPAPPQAGSRRGRPASRRSAAGQDCTTVITAIGPNLQRENRCSI